jgi:hypothetical protein
MRSHQKAAFDASWDKPYWGYLFDPRVGKTKVVLDVLAANYPARVNAALIVSYPSGVNRVWGEDEVPKDIPSALNPATVVWRSGKMESKLSKQKLSELLIWDGLTILSVNCEAIITEGCWKYVQRFLDKRRVLVCADESSFMASPGAARTKRMLAIGRHPNAVMRRITDGSPVDESALDLWAPCAFLGGRGEHPLGFRTFYAFKARYAKLDKGYARGRQFEKVVGYRNLEELSEKLARFTHRVRREDVSDAPSKTYQKRLFQLSPVQRKVYDRLREEYVAELSDRQLTIANVLDRLTKLSMVARGYFPPTRYSNPCPACKGVQRDCPDCEGLGVQIDHVPLTRIDPERNPAQEALRLEVASCRGPLIVWCRFRLDVEDALKTVRESGRLTGQYDGTIAAAEREASYLAFKGGELDAIVATVGSGISRGHDLSRALDLIYFSDGYSMRGRRQTEDRAETINRQVSTGIIDLIAEDTVDEARLEAQRNKRSLAEMIMRDKPSKWI